MMMESVPSIIVMFVLQVNFPKELLAKSKRKSTYRRFSMGSGLWFLGSL